MNLSHLELLEESGEGWHIRNKKDGKSFRVFRRGLSPRMASIVAQHFAKGGMVKPKGYAEGGIVEEPPQLTLPQQLQRAGLQAFAPMLPGVGPAVGLLGASQDVAADLGNPQMRAAALQAAGDIARAVNPVPELTNALGITSPSAQAPTVTSDAAEGAGQVVDAAPIAQPQPEAATASMPAAPVRGLVGAPSMRGFDEAMAKRASAMEEQGRIEAQRLQEQARMQAEQMQAQQAISTQYEELFRRNKAEVDALSSEIARTNITPENFWSNVSTGGKIAAGIGLLLSAIGQGLAGGENQARAALERAIDRDIDAQKANLGKKESHLSRLIQQGHSIRDAERLAKANALELASAQAAYLSSKYGALSANPKTQEGIAALKMDGEKLRIQVMSDAAKRRLEEFELALKLRGAAGSQLVAPGYVTGAIPLEDKEKSDFRTAVASRSEIQAAVAELRKIASRAGTEAFNTKDGVRMQSLAGDLKLSLKELARLGVLSESDVELMSEQIPSFKGIAPELVRNGIERLNQLERNVDRKFLSRVRALGLQRLEQPGLRGVVTE